MAYDVVHKNSTVAGTPPTASEIEVGEIAINAADAELYTKDTDGNVQSFISQFTQNGSGAVARTVGSKLKDVVSVKDFGAVGDGVTDDTAAIQAAVDQWLAANVPAMLVVPPGTYKITDTILLSPAVAISEQKVLTGYGAKILNQAAGTAIRCITNLTGKSWGNAVIEGLTVTGGVNSFSFEAGEPTNAEWMWQFTLKNLNAINFSGIGFYCYGAFFESVFYSCAAWALNTNTTGYGYKFENSPSSAISSIDIYNANTRFGLHGVYTVAPVTNVNLYGGTFLQGYEEGIRFGFASGNVISGCHVELNYQKGVDAVRAGIRVVGNAVISGVHAQSSVATVQNYAVNVYSTGITTINGGHVGGTGSTQFGYYNTGTGSSDLIISNGVTYTKAAGAKVQTSTGNGMLLHRASLQSNFYGYTASVTPNLDLGCFVSVGTLTGNITINAPTYGGTLNQGTVMMLRLGQDAVGGRTATFAAIFKGVTPISSAIGSETVWTFVWTGTYWLQVGYGKTAG